MIPLDANETILCTCRKHGFVLFTNLFALIVGAVIVVILSGFSSELQQFISGSAGALVAFGISTILVFIWTAFAAIWTDWYLDLFIVTDKRIIDIDQKRLFDRDVATLWFDRIEDVSVETRGILRTFIGYGTLRIQTAGERREFIIRDIPNPESIKERIRNARDAALHHSGVAGQAEEQLSS